MKISGPKGPQAPPDLDDLDELDKLDKLDKKTDASNAADGPEFAQALQTPQGVEQAPQVFAPQASTTIAEVTAKIKAGELTEAQAAELLIDAVVRQTAERMAPALRERLRAALRDLVENDPVLAQKVRYLTDRED